MHPALSLARMALIVREPFFAHLSMQLRYIEDTEQPTASVDGVNFRYNPDFLRTLSGRQTIYLVCHEILHCALLHITRRGGRHPEKWNIAADFVVNLMLKKSGFTPPPGDAISLADLNSDKSGYLLDPQFEGMSVDDVYARLPDPTPTLIAAAAFGACADGTGKNKGDADADGGGESTSESEMTAKWRVATAQAAAAARGQGKLAGHLAKIVEDILQPRLPWQTLLRQFVRDVTTSDFSWLRPNKGMLACHDLIMPSLKSETCGHLVVVGDTSGSMDDALLAEFVAELQAIMDEARPTTMTVMDCDARVHGVTDYQPGDTIRPSWTGRGGTDFRPPFERVTQDGIAPCALIYLTDMRGTFPDDDPGYPVLWISYSPDDKAPFGTVIKINP